MPGSYESINYALRPAKNIERRMLCDVFRRLVEFGRLESYRYIGFGSTYFSDFSLFHKSLRITNNVSIERDVENEKRFEFNRPYSCVRLEFGESNEILPKLTWDVRTIAWLDYDYKLDQGILTDVAFVCSNAPSGSIIVVTVDAKPEELGKRIESLKSRVGEEKSPQGLSEAKLGEWGTADIYRQIITNEINATINARNGGRPHGTKFLYKQIFNFHYSDSAKMLTVGGIIYDEGQSQLEVKCGFEHLEFIKTGEEPYTIEVPSLTLKEIRYLDKQLPCEDTHDLDAPSIPEKDISHDAQIYRYFPAFVEAEIG
jgi:hypothetical protein